MHPHVFIAALFTIAKTWTQPKCPSTDDRMKKMYINTVEYYSAAATWMDLDIITLSEENQRRTNSLSLICAI